MRGGATKPTVLEWLLLSARQHSVRAARAAYLGLERSPLAFLLRLPGVQWVKSRVTYIPESRVLALMDALTAAGVSSWVAGGWGVDALIGRQTRRHYDLDLVVSDTRGNIERVERVLARAGFRPGVREFNPGLAMPLRLAWQDDNGYTVEVMPVTFGEPPFTGREPLFTGGALSGHTVPCLSARLQAVLHEGYAVRAVDLADMEALRSHVNQAEWAPPG